MLSGARISRYFDSGSEEVSVDADQHAVAPIDGYRTATT